MNETKPKEHEVKKEQEATGRKPIAKNSDAEDKKKRSRGLRSLGCAENRLSKAGSKLAKALDEGFSAYRDEREKSAQKKKDGALLDFVDNVAEGVSVAQEKAAPATKDLLTAFCSKRTKKQFRKAAKAFSSVVPFLR